jgi:hypothetical protein
VEQCGTEWNKLRKMEERSEENERVRIRRRKMKMQIKM